MEQPITTAERAERDSGKQKQQAADAQDARHTAFTGQMNGLEFIEGIKVWRSR